MNRLSISVSVGVLLAFAAWLLTIAAVALGSIVPIWPFAILAVVLAALIFAVDYVTEQREKK